MRIQKTCRFPAGAAALAAAWAVALTLLVGCGAAAPDRPQPGGEPGRPVPLTDAERAVTSRAEALLVQTCMKRKGHRYWVAAPLDEEETRSFGYVMDDVAWARAHGYGSRIKQKVFEAKKSDRNLSYRAGLSPRAARMYAADLAGGPGSKMMTVRLPAGGRIRLATGGCEGEAVRKLYGDQEQWFRADRIATNLTPLYVPDLVADQRFKTAQNRWAACMRAAGHPYRTPADIRSALPGAARGRSAAQAYRTEVRLAVAEATCARRTGFGDTLRALETEHSAPVRERYRAEITKRDRLERAALRRAERILNH
ncbi:hypothetical protein [Streptomyces variegatus]|jgi:hypothetical protein|uniref:hypothetical protein n=1 Tax=Streptomyces variegatus TaxID=284040 RepID=UPI003C2C748F